MTRVDPKTSLRAVVLAPENPLPQSGTERRTSLMQTVLASVRDLDEAALRRVASLEAGTAFQPKALLALLTYCYAREIYASSEIEGLMGRDVNFRHLCGQEFPGPRHLRRFRRDNREILQTCLVAALRFLTGRLVNERTPTGSSENRLLEEAARRIEKAMFIDSMDLEDW